MPTCGGCRRSPGGVRDVPDEQGGVGGPRVARHDGFLRCLRACPRPPGSLRFSLPPQQFSRPPARPPPLGLGPTSAQPQRRARGRGRGWRGAARREPVRVDRVGAGPQQRGSGEGAARGPEDQEDPGRGRCRGPAGIGEGGCAGVPGSVEIRGEEGAASRRPRGSEKKGAAQKKIGDGPCGGSRVPRRSGDGAVPECAGIRGGGGLGGWSPRDRGRGWLESECTGPWRIDGSWELKLSWELEDPETGCREPSEWMGMKTVQGLHSHRGLHPCTLSPRPWQLFLLLSL